MNILITSIGRRVQLLQYFKQVLEGEGKVVAVDCDPTAPALHFADQYEISPPIHDPLYVPYLLELCRKYQIRAVLSLIDPELTLLASHKEMFQQQNVTVVVSEQAVVDMCLDKWKTYEFLRERSIPCIPTYASQNEVRQAIFSGELTFPFIAKPRSGSASIGIERVDSLEHLSQRWQNSDDLVVQPLMRGAEYGVDAYVDMITGEVVSLFLKKKLRMRAGETDRSVSVKDDRLCQLAMDTLRLLRPVGPVDIDIFATDAGYVISEINPRFGGGYPHAFEGGENFIHMLVNNVKGTANAVRMGGYTAGTTMVKFDQVRLL